jgi:hypothetical protein
MAVLVLGPGTGQSVSTSAIYPRRVYLVAGSANATASLKAGGGAVEFYPLAATAGSQSPNVFAVSMDTAFGSQSLPGPVTADVVGTGAKLVIEY